MTISSDSSNRSCSLSRAYATAEEASPSVEYVSHFKPVQVFPVLPRAPRGSEGLYHSQIPDPPTKPYSFHHRPITQYRSLKTGQTAISNRATIHDTANQRVLHFSFQKQPNLSECTILEWKRKSDGRFHQTPFKRHIHKKHGIMENRDLRFNHTDGQIGLLTQQILPHMPHLVSVPTTNPYLKNFKYENLNTPFEEWEIKQLQYVTLVANADRGVASVEGDWMDKISANSPNSGAGSGTATPYSERDPSKPRVKMSLADYKAGKRPTSSSQQPRSTLSQPRDISHSSATISRIRSVSPTQRLIDQIIAENQDNERPRPPPPPKDFKNAPTPNTSIQKIDAQLEKDPALWPQNVRAPKMKQEQPIQQPKISSAPEKVPTLAKRPLDAVDLRPEKRAKVEHQQTLKSQESPEKRATPSNSMTKQSHTSAKVPTKSTISNVTSKDSKQAKAVPAIREKPPISTVSQDGNTAAPNNRMPPLLSPLPASLNSPEPEIELPGGRHEKDMERTQSSPSISTNLKPHEPEPPGADPDVKTTSSSEDFDIMPPLLSPLPDWVMEQVAREKEEMALEIAAKASAEDLASTGNPNTVGARHERSRQPDAPGVARKMTKTQSARSVSKDIPAEITTSGSMKSTQKIPGTGDKAGIAGANKERRILKLKYSRRDTKTIIRILGLKPRPISEPKLRQAVAATPSGSDVKKHARSTDDDEEPSSKRTKGSANLDVNRARTPLTPSSQSPAPSGPSTAQKTSFGTPRKGDAMKSVAMLKADSSDGRVQTPHGDFTSAPASAEKPKANGVHNPKSAEIESLKAVHQRYISLGTILKRNADAILKSKDPSRPAVSEEDKKHGAVVAIESVVAYMVGFNAYGCARQLEHKVAGAENWTTFFPFLSFATERTKSYKELYTLALLLTAVSREALERVYTSRLTAELSSKVGELAKEFSKNAIARQIAWQNYGEQSKLHPVQFAVTVDEVKNVAITALAEFCKKMDIDWEKKLDF